MPARLQSSETSRTVLLDKPIIFIGRHPDCDVVINTSRKVSRKHCCLAEIDGQFMVRDLGSTNGVQINGRRVKGVEKLFTGDELMVGDCQFSFEAQENMVGQSAGTPGPAKTSASPEQHTDKKLAKPSLPLIADLIDHELSSDIPILIDEPDADGFDTQPPHHSQYIDPEPTERHRKDSSDSHMELALD